MTRTSYTLVTSDSNEIYNMSATGAILTVNAALVSAGLNVVNAFNVKAGTTLVRVSNSAATAMNLIFRAGEFAPAILGDYTVSVPAGQTSIIRLNKREAQIKNQDGSINVDFQTGFTGTFEVIGEAAHIDVGS